MPCSFRISALLLFLVVLIPPRVSAAPGDLEKIQQEIVKQKARWQAGETPYTNLTMEEKRAMLGLLPRELDPADYHLLPQFDRHMDQVDEEVDWRNRNGAVWVTPVRNQGQCGSCWAFGGIAAMEANILIAGNTPGFPLDLSEQYLVSCSPGSCDGWFAEATLNYLRDQGTVDEPCLPYMASDLVPCSNRCSDWLYRNIKLQSWGLCANVAQMKAALNVGPITGAFTVYDDFYSYIGGVYQHVWGGEAGGHMISIVGYSDSLNAWICKNSWGDAWGMDGYFLIRMGYDECGIESWAPLWLTPRQADYPNIVIHSSEVQEITGDGDQVINPGETVALTITLQNGPLAATAEDVTAQIFCEDPRVELIHSQSPYPDLSGSMTASNLEALSFSVAPNCTLGTIPVTLCVYANEAGPTPYYIQFQLQFDVSYNQAGFPLVGPESDASPAICDLNGDGHLDVISADFAGHVKAVDNQGNLLPGFPYQATGPVKGSPAAADLDGDDDLEIVLADWSGHLIVLNSDASPAFAPIALPLFVSATPVLGDLDGDENLEIVIGCWDGKLYAFHHDGTPVTGFPYNVGVGQPIQEAALLLDINGDALPEIIFGSYDHKIQAITGTAQLIWQLDLGAVPSAAPAAADLGSGEATIVVPVLNGMLYYLNIAGEEIRTVGLGAGCKSSPSFADLSGDGFPEVAVNDQAGWIHVLNAQGAEIPGYPVSTGSSIWGSSSFSDLDRDGRLDLVVADNGGNLHVRTHNGGVLAGFPIRLNGGSRSTPTLINLDQDGDLEITLGTLFGIVSIDYKAAGGNNQCWNTFRGNLRRTGNYADDFFGVAVEENESAMQPREFSLLPAHPNPFNPEVRLSYQLPNPARVILEIVDPAGRKVAVLVNESQNAGVYYHIWNASRYDVASGIYFVRLHAESPGGSAFNAVQKVLYLK